MIPMQETSNNAVGFKNRDKLIMFIVIPVQIVMEVDSRLVC